MKRSTKPRRLSIPRPRLKNHYMNERVHDFMHPSDDEGPGHDTHAIGFFDYATDYEGTAHDLHHYTDATPAGFTEV